MSTSTYYSFISRDAQTQVALDNSHRQALSPSLFASSSNSSSSLSHYSSSASSGTPTPSSSLTNASNCLSGNSQLQDQNQTQALQLAKNSHTQTHQQPQPPSRLSTSTTFHSLESRPFRPFKSNDGYLFAMKEDLAEWLNSLYKDLELNPDNFVTELETGALLCRHANCVTTMGRNFIEVQESIAKLKHSQQNDIIGDKINATQNSYILQPSKYRPTQASQLPMPSQSNQSMKSNTSIFSSNNLFTTNSSSHRKLSPAPVISPELKNSQPSLQSPRCCFKTDWFKIGLISFKQNATIGSFFARDNICQFINWCRSLSIRDCLLSKCNTSL